MTDLDYSRTKLKWNGWGWEGKSFHLGDEDREGHFWSFVQENLNAAQLPSTPSMKWQDVKLPKSKVTAAVEKKLVAILDQDRVKTDAYERIFHAVGKSYRDLLRIRQGHLPGAPDAVLYPKTTDEVVALVALAKSKNFAVIPYGGGSSVVGGVEAIGGAEHKGVWTLDMSQMDRLLEVNTTSMVAKVQAGAYGPKLEADLQAQGYTLGHYPQSFEFSTLGGWIAAKGAGQQSNRYGAADKFLVGATVVSPTGTWETRATIPHASTGPDLNHLVAGSEGTMGIITEATVKIHEVPASRDFRGYLFKTFADGANAVREINQAEVPVAMMRLSDADETRFLLQFKSLGEPTSTFKELVKSALAFGGWDNETCLLLVGCEGPIAPVASAVSQSAVLCVKNGGIPLGAKVGDNWYKNRFEMPYLRDPLLDRGCAVDTLETSTTWSQVETLHREVTESLSAAIAKVAPWEDAGCIVMCHISHSYHDGCSLYFTFVFPQATDREMEQWLEIKRAASETISKHGAAISHHHGVGMDHMRWLEHEKSALGVGMLRAARDHVDPEGMMNRLAIRG